MRPLLPLRATWCHVTPKRCITTKPASFANIKYELLNRAPVLHTDYLTPTNARLLSVSLGDDLSEDHGQNPPGLPQGYHLAYFPPAHHRTSSLLPDGTDADHSPGPPFTRRLWAGGSVSFSDGRQDELLRLNGAAAVCLETIRDVRITGVPPGQDAQTGRTPGAGEKIFVDVVRQYGAGGDQESVRARPAIEERRTLCFMTPKTAEEARRDVAEPHRRAVRAPAHETDYTRTLTPNPALLFRFSALTFNAHAIHLDRRHCREVEGYRDLLVHGPLLLTLMFSTLRGALRDRYDVPHEVKLLEYRNLAPVYVDEEMKVCVRKGKQATSWDVWIVGPTGGLCVKGTAVVGRDEHAVKKS